MDNFLVRVPLFRTLPQAELTQLAAVCELRRFRKGETIFEEGQKAAAVWIVTQGWIFLAKRTPQGSPITIFAMTPAEPICGISAFDEGVYSATAIAATETRLLSIPAEVFGRLFERYPAFAKQVLMICCQRIRRMAEAISLAQAPVQQRIAYVLLRLSRVFGKTVPLTHHELAGMVGTRWETSIRTLSSMKRHGWVTSSRGRITILSPRNLSALLGTNGKPHSSAHNGSPAQN